MKSARIQSFSGPYFPAFGLNTERYGVSLCIESECGKIRTMKTQNMDTFHVVIKAQERLKHMNNLTCSLNDIWKDFGGKRQYENYYLKPYQNEACSLK